MTLLVEALFLIFGFAIGFFIGNLALKAWYDHPNVGTFEINTNDDPERDLIHLTLDKDLDYITGHDKIVFNVKTID